MEKGTFVVQRIWIAALPIEQAGLQHVEKTLLLLSGVSSDLNSTLRPCKKKY